MKKAFIGLIIIGSFAALSYATTQFHSVGQVQLSSSTVNSVLYLTTYNKAQIVNLVPLQAGGIIPCADCTYGTLCISTGTGAGAWVNVASGTVTTGFPCK